MPHPDQPSRASASTQYGRPRPSTATRRSEGAGSTTVPRAVRTRSGQRRPRRAAAWVAGLLAAAVLVVSGTSYALVSFGESQLNRVDAFKDLLGRPSGEDGAVNYLVVGSDSRAESGEAYGGQSVQGQRGDVLIVAHVSEARDKVTMLSIPRDSYVEIPAHRDSAGRQVAASHDKANAALAFGGPSLQVATVEQLTGIRIDHYLQVDFEGFKTMVAALGTVPMCIDQPLVDPKADLAIRRTGMLDLTPAQALGIARSRAYPNGDLGRIEHQKRLLSAMLAKATSAGVLTDPGKLTAFVSAALGSVSTDQGVTASDLIELGTRLRDLSPQKVTFLTAPVESLSYQPTPGGTEYVELDPEKSAAVFAAIAADEPLPGTAATASASPAATAATATVVTKAPGSVRVRVLNGTSTAGLGATASKALATAGFAVRGSAGNAAQTVSATTVRYDPRWDTSLATLRAALPSARFVPVTGLGATFQVVAGPDWSGVHAVTARSTPTPSSSGSSTLGVTTAAQDAASC